MAVLVNHSSADIVMDTLPVIKLTEWYGHPERDEVYAYARVCISAGALRLSMTVFDGEPPATQQAIALLRLNGVLLRLVFTPDKRVQLYANGQLAPAPACLFGAGSDEQGWYWQATCTVDDALLQSCGVRLPAAGDSFEGGFFLQDAREEAFGSAFACPDGTPETGLAPLAVILY